MSEVKKVLLKVKIKNKAKNKRGAEFVETILMVGITIALIVAIFYPQIMNIMNLGFNSIQAWFNNALNSIGFII